MYIIPISQALIKMSSYCFYGFSYLCIDRDVQAETLSQCRMVFKMFQSRSATRAFLRGSESSLSGSRDG